MFYIFEDYCTEKRRGKIDYLFRKLLPKLSLNLLGLNFWGLEQPQLTRTYLSIAIRRCFVGQFTLVKLHFLKMRCFVGQFTLVKLHFLKI